MTQAYNLSQLANNLNSAGQLDATDGLVNAVPVANGGTGASTATAARSNLSAAKSGANSDITSITGLTTALSVGQGGTGATSFTASALIKGNGTSAMASATAADIVAAIGSTAVANATTAANGGVTSVNSATGAVNTYTYGAIGTSVMAASSSLFSGVSATWYNPQGVTTSGANLIRTTNSADVAGALNGQGASSLWVLSSTYVSLGLTGTWELRTRISATSSLCGIGEWVRTA